MNGSDPDLFDVAVIGGGINGAGIARDASGRGARVVLIERGDLASGTSSASTKLIHGGLRYLEHFEFGLVRESLAERERLWRIAPHCIQPLRLVLPANDAGRPAWLLRAGLFLYDHLSARRALPPTRAIRLEDHATGAPLKNPSGRAFEYSDGWCDDARLVVFNARDAARRGAQILTHHELVFACRRGDHWCLRAQQRTIKARALVNAAGPSASALHERIEGAQPSSHLRLVRGSHIVVPALFSHPFGYFLPLDDGRIIFALPFEERFTLIGTTDVDHPRLDEAPTPSTEEIDYLIAAANSRFRRQIARDDIVWCFSGVRPLVSDQSGKPEAASRGYRLALSEPAEGAPLLTVLGGKLTSFRHLSERAVDTLAERIPFPANRQWTAGEPLPGGDFPMDGLGDLVARFAEEYPFLSEHDARRITRAYGTEASRWLQGARSWRDLGESFGAGLSEAEVDWMRREEWARTASDVLWRRSKLGLSLTPSEQKRLTAVLGEAVQ